MKDLSRKVSLLCPVCGNDQFESLDVEHDELMSATDDARVKCSDCETVFTKEEIIRENSEKISIAVDDMKDEIVSDVEKELKKAFKTWKL